jgi:hypothetical protein
MALATPDFLQVKTYTAKALRAALMDRAIQSGVYGAGDFMVTQRGAGANMTVDVALGSAWVLGTTSSRQGAYHVYNDAAITGTAINANASGNPRIDQVVLHVYDSIDGGAGTDVAAIEVIQGTATVGATLYNRTGAAALPANCLLLADVLVANGAASIANSAIRDRRPWARGAYARVLRSGGADYTTSSTSVVALDSTNLNPRVEFSGVPARLTFRFRWGNASAGGIRNVMFPFIDGAVPSELTNSEWLAWAPPSAGFFQSFVMVYDFVPTPGSHQVGIGWNVSSASTATLVAATAGYPLLTVEEIVRANTANNTTTTG